MPEPPTLPSSQGGAVVAMPDPRPCPARAGDGGVAMPEPPDPAFQGGCRAPGAPGAVPGDGGCHARTPDPAFQPGRVPCPAMEGLPCPKPPPSTGAVRDAMPASGGLFRAPCSAREDAPVIYPQRGSRQPVSQDAATTPPSPKAALGSLRCGHAAHETGPAVRQHQLQV
ncbi:hypothetical protein C0Q70_01961 [Pomacea canaliculata]|uniref:Uncharacterized protein n=1 Tax=Pomacea canaliculata TaxID=400727 RepID=A0A2T7Q0Y5_POMCA|nr:hypothetical protein C0Q70_01961 [Pomacea canaliculata]